MTLGLFLIHRNTHPSYQLHWRTFAWLFMRIITCMRLEVNLTFPFWTLELDNVFGKLHLNFEGTETDRSASSPPFLALALDKDHSCFMTSAEENI